MHCGSIMQRPSPKRERLMLRQILQASYKQLKKRMISTAVADSLRVFCSFFLFFSFFGIQYSAHINYRGNDSYFTRYVVLSSFIYFFCVCVCGGGGGGGVCANCYCCVHTCCFFFLIISELLVLYVLAYHS